MKTVAIVTCFLEANGKILLLKRSKKVSTYQDKWAAVSGYMESTPEKQAFQEIKEETGLEAEDIELIKQGGIIEAIDKELDRKWLIHLFLFKVKCPEKIRLDWENVEMKWVLPQEISKYPTVPKLKESLETLL